MYEVTTTNTNTDSAKESFRALWKRPGGLFAKITGVAAIAAVLYGLYKVLPFLVAAASNLLVLILELVAIVAILFVLSSKEFRRGVQLSWLQIMRKFYGWFVNIDPIAILQNGINEMKKKLLTVKENVTNLQAILESMKKKLEEYKKTFKENKVKKESLEKKIADPKISSNDVRRYKTELQLIDNEIARGAEQIKSQNQRIATSEKYLDVMKKLELAADFRVKDAQNELNYRKDEYEQAKSQQKAVGSIMSIIKGDLTKTLEEEIAMDSVTTTINTSLAEMKRLLDGSNDILTNFELDSEVNTSKADEILAAFDKDGFSIFNAGEDKISTKNVAALPEPPKAAILINKEAVKTENKYF